ncbi:MAG: GNAT family N-acetyltransferase [Cyanobacteriota bacterium]|nr:GNAT family N-acetyltransferase [Cyanobacteriota bacterium]
MVPLQIAHLFQHPQAIPQVADWIYQAFWADQPAYDPVFFEQRLAEAVDPHHLPLSLLALIEGIPVGTINLIANDDPNRPHLFPWLAALYVVPSHRRRGIGSTLVIHLQQVSHQLGFSEVYLGTDIPNFYRRLGAELSEQTRSGLSIMRLPCPVR